MTERTPKTVQEVTRQVLDTGWDEGVEPILREWAEAILDAAFERDSDAEYQQLRRDLGLDR